MKKVLYYEDELKDDFSKVKFNSKPLEDTYQYIPTNIFRRMIDFILFKCLATPFGYIYSKVVWHEKYINKKVLKPYHGTGYFIYANHTRIAGDAFTPGVVCFPNKDYIITNNDSASNPFVRFFTKSLGALPLPSSLKGFKSFHTALKQRVDEGHPIVIYPEAHIWPYYTKIRPFTDSSFHYPVEMNKPVFTFTVTYQKRKYSKRPKTTIYVDGPFFMKEELTRKENQKYLRDCAYNTMVERSKNSTYEYVQFIKKENTNNEENK